MTPRALNQTIVLDRSAQMPHYTQHLGALKGGSRARAKSLHGSLDTDTHTHTRDTIAAAEHFALDAEQCVHFMRARLSGASRRAG